MNMNQQYHEQSKHFWVILAKFKDNKIDYPIDESLKPVSNIKNAIHFFTEMKANNFLQIIKSAKPNLDCKIQQFDMALINRCN